MRCDTTARLEAALLEFVMQGAAIDIFFHRINCHRRHLAANTNRTVLRHILADYLGSETILIFQLGHLNPQKAPPCLILHTRIYLETNRMITFQFPKTASSLEDHGFGVGMASSSWRDLKNLMRRFALALRILSDWSFSRKG